MTRENFRTRIVEECMDELYRASQPSITWNELLEKAKVNPKERYYEQHYLHNEECTYIIEKYIDLYNLRSHFYNHCDIIIRDMIEGCSKDKYIEPEDGSPGYRGYEKVAPLSETIGKENLDKVVEFIKMRKDFYRYDRDADALMFQAFNYSPCSNKQTVIDYWKSQGKDIEIIDRDQSYNFERYYYECSEEEINEMIEEDKYDRTDD